MLAPPAAPPAPFWSDAPTPQSQRSSLDSTHTYTPRSTPRSSPRKVKRKERRSKDPKPLVEEIQKLAAADPSDEFGSLRRLSARLGQAAPRRAPRAPKQPRPAASRAPSARERFASAAKERERHFGEMSDRVVDKLRAAVAAAAAAGKHYAEFFEVVDEEGGGDVDAMDLETWLSWMGVPVSDAELALLARRFSRHGGVRYRELLRCCGDTDDALDDVLRRTRARFARHGPLDARTVLRSLEASGDLGDVDGDGRVDFEQFLVFLDAFGVRVDDGARAGLEQRFSHHAGSVSLDEVAHVVDGDATADLQYARACAKLGAPARRGVARRLPARRLAVNDDSLTALDARALALAHTATVDSSSPFPETLDLGGNHRVGDAGARALADELLLDEARGCVLGGLELERCGLGRAGAEALASLIGRGDVPGCVEINHWFGTSRPNFEIL